MTAFIKHPYIMIMIYNGKKTGHNGPEETTYMKHGVGLHIKMITVNGWCADGKGGGGGVRVQTTLGDGERLLSNLSPTVS